MRTLKVTKRNGFIAIGGGGLLLSAIYLALSLQLPAGTLRSPGAAVFPILVALLVAIGSIAAIVEGWRMEREEQVDLPVGGDFWRLAVLLSLLLAYFVVLPIIGQLLTSLLFTAALMRLLAPRISWLAISAWSAGLMFPLYYIFVELLRVPMPRGAFF